MSFTPEQRAKALDTRRANALAKKEKAERAKSKKEDVVSVKGTPPEALDRLLKEISDLKGQLAISEASRSEAEKAALAAAEAQGGLLQSEILEVPTGKRVKVDRLASYKVVGHKDNGQEILRPVFKKVELPTFYYKVDMPPVGGLFCSVNGTNFYQGTVYEFDIDTLRTVKEMVFRLWAHDRSIHPNDENFYRKDANWQMRNQRAMSRGVF